MSKRQEPGPAPPHSVAGNPRVKLVVKRGFLHAVGKKRTCVCKLKLVMCKTKTNRQTQICKTQTTILLHTNMPTNNVNILTRGKAHKKTYNPAKLDTAESNLKLDQILG